jgi:DNA repair exonuclease SbcCD nuclease subunit
MNSLITTDLHLSDRARDKHRFGLFRWLARQQEKYDVEATYILGDLTENKDRHSSLLVNRIVEELFKLKPPVFVLRGNHDGLDPNSPYFKFLNCIEGLQFVVDPCFNKALSVAFVPHCADQVTFNRACKQMPPKPALFLTHATFTGAKAETGTALSGLSASPIELLQPGRVYSGDVHVPQRCGPVTYVGAPFHVKFGDRFTPRVLLLKGDRETDLHFDCPRKLTLTVRDVDDILNNKELKVGDQVKLVIEMAREEAVEWQATKQRILAACREGGLEVFGAELKINTTARRERVKLNEGSVKSPLEVMTAFCKAEGIASVIKAAGLELLTVGK